MFVSLLTTQRYFLWLLNYSEQQTNKVHWAWSLKRWESWQYPLTVLECMVVSIIQAFVVKTLPSFNGSFLDHSQRWNANLSIYGMICETAVLNTASWLNKLVQTTGENKPIFLLFSNFKWTKLHLTGKLKDIISQRTIEQILAQNWRSLV